MLKTDVIQKALILNKDRKALVVRRSGTDERRPLQWDFPGGILEKNESMEEGIIREAYEETGLKVAHPSAIFTKTEHRIWDKGESNAVYIFYLVNTSEKKIKLSFEHDKFEWIDLCEALNMFEYDLHKEFIGYVLDNQLEL